MCKTGRGGNGTRPLTNPNLEEDRRGSSVTSADSSGSSADPAAQPHLWPAMWQDQPQVPPIPATAAVCPPTRFRSGAALAARVLSPVLPSNATAGAGAWTGIHMGGPRWACSTFARPHGGCQREEPGQSVVWSQRRWVPSGLGWAHAPSYLDQIGGHLLSPSRDSGHVEGCFARPKSACHPLKCGRWGGGLFVPILHANAMHHALKLVLHATLYSTCSILLYSIADTTKKRGWGLGETSLNE